MSISGLDELMVRLGNHVRTRGRVIIGIDGAIGAGKSCLAHAIGSRFGETVISLDKYVTSGKGRYRTSIRYQSLRQDLERYKGQERVLVVEGVCLLEILDRVDVSPDVVVYVKRVSRNGYWLDEETCDRARGLRELLRDIRSREERVKRPGIGDLEREVAEYHCHYTPLARATYVYHRVDS